MSDIMRLKELTGAGVMDCKNALAECGGDVDKAIAMLHEKEREEAERYKVSFWLQKMYESLYFAPDKFTEFFYENCVYQKSANEIIVGAANIKKEWDVIKHLKYDSHYVGINAEKDYAVGIFAWYDKSGRKYRIYNEFFLENGKCVRIGVLQ
ncbi:MAG: hypothetical protein FWD32_02495 [Firmicutes bacterium]|nr:hypothetical protein [Bacillota bacterium]